MYKLLLDHSAADHGDCDLLLDLLTDLGLVFGGRERMLRVVVLPMVWAHLRLISMITGVWSRSIAQRSIAPDRVCFSCAVVRKPPSQSY